MDQKGIQWRVSDISEVRFHPPTSLHVTVTISPEGFKRRPKLNSRRHSIQREMCHHWREIGKGLGDDGLDGEMTLYASDSVSFGFSHLSIVLKRSQSAL
ncbi:hypothetical protein J6590_006103 [Homalodisca vitripennis]|nr:hypothetical protein J6590_006103 [Homalodisca vitripennis]